MANHLLYFRFKLVQFGYSNPSSKAGVRGCNDDVLDTTTFSKLSTERIVLHENGRLWKNSPSHLEIGPTLTTRSAEAVGFSGEKILSTPSFGGEIKPSVPCRRFAAC